jgi:hydrogenase small subunit
MLSRSVMRTAKGTGDCSQTLQGRRRATADFARLPEKEHRHSRRSAGALNAFHATNAAAHRAIQEVLAFMRGKLPLATPDDDIPGAEERFGLPRRQFLQFCVGLTATLGLSRSAVGAVAKALVEARRPSVIWLHFQECTGCSESLLRAEHPTLEKLILDVISLDYHETLMAAAGYQAEAARNAAMAANKGKYLLVVEGAIPTGLNGNFCKIGGKTAVELIKECAADAAAVVAIGSCASWGGIPSADPNPTGATGAPMILKGKTVVTIPGCPANPYNFLGVVLQYATLGTLPKLDELGRPLFAYGRTIHEHCPRRAHFDAGRFANVFGDEGHRQGYCLYKLGCKGPMTHANCSTLAFGEVVDCWPIGIGHPCVGCTEQKVAFRIPMHATASIDRPVPPDTYPPIHAEQGRISPAATAVAGVIGGALVGAGFVASKKVDRADAEIDRTPDTKLGV